MGAETAEIAIEIETANATKVHVKKTVMSVVGKDAMIAKMQAVMGARTATEVRAPRRKIASRQNQTQPMRMAMQTKKKTCLTVHRQRPRVAKPPKRTKQKN